MNQTKLIKLLILWVTSTLTLLIISTVFSNDIVLGNAVITKPVSAVIVGLILTILIEFVPIAAKKYNLKLSNEKTLIAAYFVVNAVALWIIKRLADITGLGISNILFVLVLAVFVAFIQFGMGKYSTKYLKKL